MQLLCVGIPPLERLSKQGEEGRKKDFAVYPLSHDFARRHSIGRHHRQFCERFQRDSDLALFRPDLACRAVHDHRLYGGAMLVMWLGERITDYGVGNGQSMIIFVGILSTAGQLIVQKIGQVFTEDINVIWELVFFVLVAWSCSLRSFTSTFPKERSPSNTRSRSRAERCTAASLP